MTEDQGLPPPREDSAVAILERHGLEPATIEEFEAEYGPIARSDGEG